MITRVQSALLCDEVRTENTGKNLYIGVYGAELISSHKPAVIPLTIALQIALDGSGTDLEVRSEGGGYAGLWKRQIPPGLRLANLHIAANIIMTEDRDLRVFVRNRGSDWGVVGEWAFKFHPEATPIPQEAAAEIEAFAEASREQAKRVQEALDDDASPRS